MRNLLVVLAMVAVAMLIGCNAVGGAGSGVGKGAVAVEAENCTLSGATVKAYPKAGGGKAVLMDKDNSEITTTVTLPAGKYEVIVTGMAQHSDEDALDLQVSAVDPKVKINAIYQRICFDGEWNAFKPASSTPVLTMPEKSKVKVVLVIDNETGMAIDRLEFRPVQQ